MEHQMHGVWPLVDQVGDECQQVLGVYPDFNSAQGALMGGALREAVGVS